MRLLVAVGAAASIVHFADNATSMSRYPGPGWITPLGVWLAWIPIGLLCGYLLLARQHDRRFRFGVLALAVLLMAGLLHFAYGSIGTMSPLSSAMVIFEAACGMALLLALVLESRPRSSGLR